MKESFEKNSDSKEKLHALEQTGSYLFHGSASGSLEILEPRQSTHIPDLNKSEESILDGKPAISATPYSDIAIFRSIINNKNINFSHTSGFGSNNGEFDFRVSSEEVLDKAKNKIGYVYVFDKKDFEPYNRDGEATEKSMEWRSYKSVKSIEKIEVNFNDLPEKSKIDIG